MQDAYQIISFRQAHDMMLEEADYCFFDVREDEEYITGHAEGAELFSLGSIDKKSAAERIPKPDTPVFLYCRSGARSHMAAQKLLSY